MKKYLLFLFGFVSILSMAQTTTTPQNFNSPLNFNVVAPSAGGTSKVLLLQNNNRVSYMTIEQITPDLYAVLTKGSVASVEKPIGLGSANLTTGKASSLTLDAGNFLGFANDQLELISDNIKFSSGKATSRGGRYLVESINGTNLADVTGNVIVSMLNGKPIVINDNGVLKDANGVVIETGADITLQQAVENGRSAIVEFADEDNPIVLQANNPSGVYDSKLEIFSSNINLYSSGLNVYTSDSVDIGSDLVVKVGTPSQYTRYNETFQFDNPGTYHYGKSIFVNNPITIQDGVANTDAASLQQVNAKVADVITDGVTTIAPSENAVFDALTNKADLVMGKVPLSQINDALIGSVNYQGTYNIPTDTPPLPTPVGNKGKFYVINTAGTYGGVPYLVGDWIISNGTMWDKVTQVFPVDAVPTNGSNNAVSSDGTFDGLALKAPLASPALTGTPTVPNVTLGTSNTTIANTAFVNATADAKVVDGINDGVTSIAPSENAVFDALATKQPNLVSGTNIKTVETQSVVGAGNIDLTKADVGLANADDTSDATKPVSGPQQTALDLKANIASPTLTGDPKSVTPTAGDNDTSIATTAFVKTAVDNSNVLTNGKIFIGNGSNIATEQTVTGDVTISNTGATTIANSAVTLAKIQDVATGVVLGRGTTGTGPVELLGGTGVGNVIPRQNSPTFTGTPFAPTASPGANSTQIATTAYVDTADALKADLVSPTFTGDPKVPTAAAADNDTSIASTAFVKTANANNILQGGNTFGTAVSIGTNDDNSVILKRNNATFLTLNSTSISTAAAFMYNNVNATLTFGTAAAATRVNRSISDARPAFEISNSASPSTGDILTLYSDTTGGGTAIKGGVRKDGRFYGPDGTVAGDYYTLGQATTQDALNAHLAGTETFTGAKTFTTTAPKFSSVNFEGSMGESFSIKAKIASGTWSRGFNVQDNSNNVFLDYGVYGTGQTFNYGYIGLGNTAFNGAIMKFTSTGVGIGLTTTNVPSAGAMLQVNGNSILTGFTRVTSTASASRFSVYNDFATTAAAYGAQIGSTRGGLLVSVDNSTVQNTDIVFSTGRYTNADVGSGLISTIQTSYGDGNTVFGPNAANNGFKLDTRGTVRALNTGQNGLGNVTALTVATDARTISDGVNISFQGLNSSSNTTAYASINTIFDGITAGAHSGRLVFRTTGLGVVYDALTLTTTGDVQTKTVAVTLDFPSVVAQSSSDLTLTYPGAALGDTVIVGLTTGVVLAGTIITGWVSSTNTITLRCNNYTTSPKDIASGTYNVKILK